MHPPAPPPPNTAFGKLPAIKFPQEKTGKPKTIQLETIEGGLPKDLPESGKVYFIPQIGGKFLSLEKAKNLAKKMGFVVEPRKITEEIYFFENNLTNTTMKINVLTESFEYAYSYISDQTLISPPTLPNDEGAVEIAKSFLAKIGKTTDELIGGEQIISYWKISGSSLQKADASGEADFIRVDMFRKEIEEKYPIVSPTDGKSLVSILISGRDINSEKVVEVKYTHFPADPEKYGTYPLKTVDQAWAEIQSGNFYLASSGEDSALPETVKVRKVFLAYFDPPYLAKFLSPIFVFQGDRNFFGYVSAIPTEWSE